MSPSPFRLMITVTTLLTFLCAAHAKTYIAISSGTCESAGFKAIYDKKECERGAAMTGLDYKVRFTYTGSSQNQVAGCNVPEDDTNGGFAIVAGRSGDVCLPGDANPFYSRASKEFKYRTCDCNRFDPCICIKN